ncbi:hypothetical protein ABVK25_006287 [Lepraria finkii]|uniref:Uncharacterized protein n=1 Tax=Lepraria finkii TaxID=1340010 RepID=A0ABR4B604_9LECA
MQIRAWLQSQLLPPHAANLPLNVVYDCGTIRELSRYLKSVRKGQSMDKEDEIRLMHDLVKEYNAFNNASHPTQGPEASPFSIPLTFHGHTVVLTGVTGALGAHILSLPPSVFP